MWRTSPIWKCCFMFTLLAFYLQHKQHKPFPELNWKQCVMYCLHSCSLHAFILKCLQQRWTVMPVKVSFMECSQVLTGGDFITCMCDCVLAPPLKCAQNLWHPVTVAFLFLIPSLHFFSFLPVFGMTEKTAKTEAASGSCLSVQDSDKYIYFYILM